MSLPTALALLALLLSVFAILAAGAVYARLRMMEQTVLKPGNTRLDDELRLVPQPLWPAEGQTGALVLLLDANCSVCHQVWEAAGSASLPTTRLTAVFSHTGSAQKFDGPVEKLTDPELWTALYEGYTPCVYAIDGTGQVTARRFVYGDTDLPALFAELSPALSSSGSNHAS
ncbi:hypothetical protein [Streptosporangium sp. NPDC000396]|uniref:hypothetical protein n=1 Tax=Streptosporangium sp. NPDC000396 TaxID=3366185 RepID=UPI0036AE2666